MSEERRRSGEPRRLAELLPGIQKLAVRQPLAPVSPDPAIPRILAARAAAERQGELFKADSSWMPILRAPFRLRTMAKLGPMGIATYIALKARADLNTGTAVVSIPTLAADVGMSERSARQGIRLLEGEGLIESTLGSGKRTQYRFVERLQIVNSEGTPVASVEWQFLPLAWKENLNRALQAAMGQLETGAPINATINVGTINVLIVPGRSDD